MKQEFIDLYDSFTHGVIDRRTFMDRLTKAAGGTAAAAAVIGLLKPNYAQAAITEPNDARLSTDRITFKGATGEVKAYQARPKSATGPLPAVIVVHENRGLNPHIEDVTRRVALAGYHALGVDFMSMIGGTPANTDTAAAEFAKVEMAKAAEDGVAAVNYLKSNSGTNGKVGAMGFCWGGGMVNQIAVRSPDLLAAAPYYGPVPAADDAAKIKATMALHYAGLDQRINAGIPAYEEALKTAKVNYTIYMYPDANHAFNNDTSAERYNKAAADLAWTRTMELFQKTLGSTGRS